MNTLLEFGTIIKNKRLSLDLRMDDVANRANITRATLSSIEKGTGNYSFSSVLKVLNILGLSLIVDSGVDRANRARATRINSVQDKKINRFVVFTVEQYAKSVNRSSAEVYQRMKEKGIVDDLTNDYEDLHGMSTVSLNEYIDTLLEA